MNEQINQYQLGGTFVSPAHSNHVPQGYSSAGASAGAAAHTVTPYSANSGSNSKAYTPSARYEYSAPYSASSVAKSESFGATPQTANMYPIGTSAAATGNAAASQRGQEVRTSYLQGYKSIAATMPTSSSALSGEDPYRVGLRKLGLEAEFGDDFIRGLHSGSPQASLDISHEEVDLDMLGYYSLAGDTSSKRSTAKAGAHGTTGT